MTGNGAGATDGGPQPDGPAGATDGGDVVDADYEEVDEEKKKKGGAR